MATFTNQGLPNNGVTAAGHYSVAYDTSFSGAAGLDLAANLMAICESDFALMSNAFSRTLAAAIKEDWLVKIARRMTVLPDYDRRPERS